MRALLQEGVLTWSAVLLLGSGALLAALQLLRGGVYLGRAARWCAGLGGYLLLLSLLARGVQLQAWPIAGTYEIVLLTAAAMALFYALGLPRRLGAIGGVCAGLLALLLVVLALLLTPAGARQPSPVLRGIWFPLHTISTAIGYGGLLLAGGVGTLRLLFPQDGAGEGKDLSRDLAALSWCSLAWGYPWLTLGMTLGALWGWQAWGRYWSWSVKEVLTLLTWGLFTLAFHTRRLRGWRGRPHAAVLAAGLLALLLTLLAMGALARALFPTTRYIF